MKFTPKKSVLPLLTIIFLLLAVQVVSAASQSGNIFDSFKNIFGSDFGQLYKDNWWIVDLIVYLFFFGYIGKLALGGQFQGKGGSLGVVFGVILAIALVAFEAKTGFKLGDLGPYAMAVLVLALAFITWKFFHGLGMGNGGAAAFAVVVVYGTLATVASPLLKALRDSDNSTIQMFASIIDILLLIAVIAVAWNGFSFVFRLFRGGGGVGGLRDAFTNKKEEQREEAGERREEAEDTMEQKEERRIQALVNRIDAIEKRNYQDVDRMVKDVDELIRLLQSGRRDPQVVEAIGYKLKDISLSEADIKNITVALRNTVAELDATEKAEVKLATDALKGARRLAGSELKTDLGRSLNAAERRKLTTIQSNTQKYIENLAMQEWTETRRVLDNHIAIIAGLETQLPNLFTQAVDYLKVPGRLRSAIAALQSGRGLLMKIKAAIQSLERMDIPRLKGRISATLKELQIERNLADRLKEDFKKP